MVSGSGQASHQLLFALLASAQMLHSRGPPLLLGLNCLNPSPWSTVPLLDEINVLEVEAEKKSSFILEKCAFCKGSDPVWVCWDGQIVAALSELCVK